MNRPWSFFSPTTDQQKALAGVLNLFAGGKHGVLEGSFRVPLLVRWPGMIEGGRVSDDLSASMDLLPTLAAFAGLPLLPGLEIDGLNLSSYWLDREDGFPKREQFLFYRAGRLAAVREGRWKLHLRDSRLSMKRQLYDLSVDPGERDNLVDIHPAIVERLLDLAEEGRADLGSGLRKGEGERKSGKTGVWKPILQSLPLVGADDDEEL